MSRLVPVVSTRALALGFALTIVVNGAFWVVAATSGPIQCLTDSDCSESEQCVKRPAPGSTEIPEYGICISRSVASGGGLPGGSTVRHGLCGKRRCSLPEIKFKRRKLEPLPIEQMELMAQLVPALGMRAPDPKQLPKLQTHEQEKIVKSGVNLDRKNKRRKRKLRKKFDPKKARRDPKSLQDVLKNNHDEEDLRKKATRLEDMVGDKDGDIDGVRVKQMGHRYAWKVRRKIRPLFRAPNIEPDKLKTMRITVKVTSLRADGAILKYRVVYRSSTNTPAFTNAALDVVKRFVKPRRGEPELTLPKPEPELLRLLNAKGLKLRLTGKDMLR